jgi:hypothetical protein
MARRKTDAAWRRQERWIKKIGCYVDIYWSRVGMYIQLRNQEFECDG